MKNQEAVLDYLEIVTQALPIPIYWLDRNNRLIGANNHFYKTLGFKPTEILGKRAYDVYPPDIANNIIQHDNYVMHSGISSSQEEMVKDSLGRIRYFTSVKTPLYDDKGTVIGIIGSSVEITAEKEIEKLRLSQLEEHHKFKQIADQMAHDLGSPLMALSVLENSCSELPEEKRNMLRESISRIRDIAGSLLSQYKPLEEDADKIVSEELLVYAALEQVLMDKQYEYHNLDIKFEGDYDKDSVFSFIEANPSSFKRMLSNLINNSVDAMENKSGKINVKLSSDKEEIKVSIVDTGKGMPESIINKLLNNISVTSGKENGKGIGYTQIHETLKQSNGKIEITSQSGIGTTITLRFPRIKTPEWIAEEVEVMPNDTVVVLDDDSSIHGAWDIRFADILKSTLDINIAHFKNGQEAINYLNNLEAAKKKHVLLLTDYELLKQNIDGLSVIDKTQLHRSILVTSHYNNLKIRQQALERNTKVLPKILATFVKINTKLPY